MVLKVESTRVYYELELRYKLTLIIGDSATGKTTLINTINEANRNKRIKIESEYPVIIVNSMELLTSDIQLEKSRVYIIDERDVDNEFARLYNKSTNSYFIIISRDAINKISYSPESICTLQKDGRNHYLQYINVIDSKYKDDIKIDTILTEDQGAGFKWLSSVISGCNITNTFEVSEKGGNTGIIDSVSMLLSNENKPILLFVDFGGFGYYYQTFIRMFRKELALGNLYFDKRYICFEYLLAKSNIVKAGDLTIKEDLASKSLENAWENKLAELTREKAYYHKHETTECSKCYSAPCCHITNVTKRANLGKCDGRLVGPDKFELMFKGTEFEYLINMRRSL